MAENKMQEQLQMLQLLAHGKQEIKAGNVFEHDDVFAGFAAEDSSETVLNR